MRYVVIPGFVCPPLLFEAFGNIRRNRNSSATHLRIQAKYLMLRERLSQAINGQNPLMRLLPNFQIFKSLRSQNCPRLAYFSTVCCLLSTFYSLPFRRLDCDGSGNLDKLRENRFLM